MKKRCFTLMEMLVTLFLFSLLASSLLFWYKRVSMGAYEQKAHYKPIFKEQLAYRNLQKIFHHIPSHLSGNPSIFFSQQEGDGSTSLIFTLDNGVWIDPYLSHHVFAKLHLHNRGLYMTIWPQLPHEVDPSDHSHQFLVLDDIDSLSYSFLAPESLTSSHEFSTHSQGGWYASWPREAESKPALVQVKIQSNQAHSWIFDLKEPIIYKEIVS
jgi:hypothetical protein